MAATLLAAACMRRGPSTAVAIEAVFSAPRAWLVTQHASATTATLRHCGALASASNPKLGAAGPHAKPTVVRSTGHEMCCRGASNQRKSKCEEV